MRTLILCCVVAVLALGSWLLLMAPDAAPTAPSPVTDAKQTQNVPPSIADAPDTPQPEFVAREAVTTRDAADNEAPPLPDDAKWLEVTVVDAQTQEPAAEVDVWWSNDAQWNMLKSLPLQERNALFFDRDLLATRFGWHARTDDNGRIRVTPGQNGTSVMARDATRYGTGYFSDKKPAPDGGLRLELQRELVLRVHVVDAAGNDAVDVRLQIAQYDPDSPQAPQFRSDGALRTDANGAATFRHLQQMRKWSSGPRQGQPVASLALAITTLDMAAQATMTPLPFDALPDDPVELRLPATGHLEVRFSFAGAPLPSLEQVMLHAADRDDADTLNRAWRALVEEDGTARFAHVPLGMQFSTGEYQWKVEVAGPTQPGELVRHVVDLTELLHVLTGRLLLPDGSPAAGASVMIRYALGRGQEPLRGGGGQPFKTGDDGRFFLVLRGRPEPDVEWQLGEMRFELLDQQQDTMHATAAARPLTVGRNDLGDLRLGASALVASGQIVIDCDRLGTVRPMVERLEPMQVPGRDGVWQQADELKVVVIGDRFEVRGEAPAGRHRLTVPAFTHLPVEPIEFRPGQHDLRIEVHCGNRPEITCLLPDKLPPGALRVTMVQPNAKKKSNDPFDITSSMFDPSFAEYAGVIDQARGAHRFQWRALPDGRYTLRIHGAAPAPLVEIADVVLPLPAGGDARLIDIDLRQLVTTLRLVVKVGEKLEQRTDRDIMVFALPEPPADDWFGAIVHRGEIVLAVPPGPIDLLVHHYAGRPVTLRGVQGEAEVTVDAWPTVELTFAGIDALPEGAQLVASTMRPESAPRTRDDRRYHAGGRSGDIGSLTRERIGQGRVEGDKVTLQMAEDVAPLTVALRVGRRSKQLTQFSPSQVVAGQPVTVQLSAEELQRVAEELQAQNGKK